MHLTVRPRPLKDIIILLVFILIFSDSYRSIPVEPSTVMRRFAVISISGISPMSKPNLSLSFKFFHLKICDSLIIMRAGSYILLVIECT